MRKISVAVAVAAGVAAAPAAAGAAGSPITLGPGLAVKIVAGSATISVTPTAPTIITLLNQTKNRGSCFEFAANPVVGSPQCIVSGPIYAGTAAKPAFTNVGVQMHASASATLVVGEAEIVKNPYTGKYMTITNNLCDASANCHTTYTLDYSNAGPLKATVYDYATWDNVSSNGFLENGLTTTKVAGGVGIPLG